MEGRYSHLYKTSTYVAPSVVRQMEEASANIGEVFGETRFLQGRNTIENVTGQNYMKNLTERTLRNKDTYRRMKNKILYSLDADIQNHGIINRF